MSQRAEVPAACPPPHKPLSVTEKLAVGTGGLAVSLGNQSVRVTGQGVLNMILHINAFWVGLVLAASLFWDAMIDPVVGHISDNFRSRFGRRRPFIVVGALLMGVTFASIWMVPLAWSDAGKLVWFIVTSLLFYTAYSVFSVPYFGLTYELTPDYDERTAVQGFVTLWNRLGEMSYMGLIPLSLAYVAWKYGYADTAALSAPEKMEGIRSVAAVYGFFGMTVFGLLPAFFAKERLYAAAASKPVKKSDPFWQSAKTALQNKACVYLVVLTVAAIIAGIFASNLDWYLLIYYMSGSDVALGTQWKLIVTIGYATVGVLGIPLVVWLTSRMSKIRGLQFVYCTLILNAAVRWIVYQPGRIQEALHWGSGEQILNSLVVVAKSLIWLDPLTGGVFWIGIGILGQAMTADICDEDELRCGMRREGVFGAIFSWIQKVGYSAAFFGAFLSLKMTGFDAAKGGHQSDDTILRLRLILAISTAVWAILAILLLRAYPLSKARAHEIRDALEQRRGKR